MRKIRIANAEGRDATVAYETLRGDDLPELGLPGEPITFKRYLAVAPSGHHDQLVAAHGDDYAQALIDGDPEIDVEVVGRELGPTDNVFLDNEGEVLYAPPEIIEIVLNPDGSEKARRQPEDVPANVNEALPIRWSKMMLKRGDLSRRFAFRRTLQLHHVDGLTYDFLYGMAKALNDAGEAVYVGGGESGKEPLVFQDNGAPYRGFLEGRVDGQKYQLLLHLSSLELKQPKEPV